MPTEKFHYLNGKNVVYPRVSEIAWCYIEKDEKTFDKMKKYFIENKKAFQYVYAICYPDIYKMVEKSGIDLRGKFLIDFKAWKDKKRPLPPQEQFEQKGKPKEKTESDNEIVEHFNEQNDREKQEKMEKKLPKSRKKEDLSPNKIKVLSTCKSPKVS